MPKRSDLKKIMIIGSGPIVIGQACEFDYSGTQAIKALKEEGYEVILVNSNPATIMTDPDLSDRVYIEPIELQYLTAIIEKERPDALLPTVGGQTALNATLNLYDEGIIDKYNIEIIGANVNAIRKAEDRELFKKAMQKIGVNVPPSGIVRSLNDAHLLVKEIGYPVILRPSFTLGGTGGGVCYNKDELENMVLKGLAESPVQQILMEKSMLGWKEFELEVMRDHADNVVIVCSIENLDPMGVHTGDSITVAPQQTLSDKEYQKLRDQSIAIIREIGVETGGSNIQFAVNPVDGEIIVIEMNPRVSRSSALASKATGFPIARVAAKLSIGYSLDEIMNDITKKTPVSFEPVIDYVVTKIPRFTFEKFPETSRVLDTQMRSVGEAMAIGRTFPESFQKALRSLETGRNGWGVDGQIDIDLEVQSKVQQGSVREFLKEAISIPNDLRIYYIRSALTNGFTIEEIYKYSMIDPWFLHQFQGMLAFEQEFKEFIQTESKVPLKKRGVFDREKLKSLIRKGKRSGYSNRQLAYLADESLIKEKLSKLIEYEKGSMIYFDSEKVIKDLIKENEFWMNNFSETNKVEAVYKRVDTCAAEFESYTPYLYSTMESECESLPTAKEKVIILGGGPNRIGQGIEFDYCCCHASFALQSLGYESIMVNSNPETVSTDFDISDRLYFEPLTIDSIEQIYKKESTNGKVLGVILQFGGQTPLKLAHELNNRGIKILGTSCQNIDRAEDREQFNALIQKLSLKQPEGAMAITLDQALESAEKIGYPVLVRPSYVLGGRAMQIVHTAEKLREYMKQSTEISAERPVLIDDFLASATELDVDALCDGQAVYIAGILEHIEETGVHSGDSACIIPTRTISKEMIVKIEETTRKLALELNVIGLLNIQFAIQQNELYVIEVNPRASRTVPFVSKATGVALAKMATSVIMGKSLKELGLISSPKFNLYYVKEVVLPFKKFAGVDTILGPEMKSTGEVMGIGKTPYEAFFKAQLGSGCRLPLSGTIFVSVNDESKELIAEDIYKAQMGGFKIVATANSAKFFSKFGVNAEVVLKVHEGRPNIVDRLISKEIDLVINIPQGERTRNDAFDIRMATLKHNIPYMTTVAAAKSAIEGMINMKKNDINIYCVSDDLSG